jgi:hypothetical protein
MLSAVDRYVIARESNIVRVDFNREPDPPAPRFPGANGRRLDDSARQSADTRIADLFAPSRLADQKIRLNVLNGASA